MPTYEYECDACGHAFERLQRMTDPAVRKCPKCRRTKVRRLISGGAGVIFKGSGFYETDYKRKRTAAGAGGSRSESGPTPKDSSGASESSGKSSESGDSKPSSDKGSPKPDAPSKAPSGKPSGK